MIGFTYFRWIMSSCRLSRRIVVIVSGISGEYLPIDAATNLSASAGVFCLHRVDHVLGKQSVYSAIVYRCCQNKTKSKEFCQMDLAQSNRIGRNCIVHKSHAIFWLFRKDERKGQTISGTSTLSLLFVVFSHRLSLLFQRNKFCEKNWWNKKLNRSLWEQRKTYFSLE